VAKRNVLMSSSGYKRYVLGSLTLVFGLVYFDRFFMTLFLQPIKEDLHLSDTELGFLTGIAFGLFYATLGLPIARWADRGDRVTITAIALGLWGMAAGASLLVTNFAQLALVRVAAGVGEAGCMPPTYSLLGDYFPGASERTRAMTIYWLGAGLATLVGFSVGGWLGEHYGWRMAFLAIGVPGILVGGMVKVTVIEPRTYAKLAGRRYPRMAQVLVSLCRQQSSRHLGLAVILLFALGQGLTPWYAAFLVRSHGMSTSEVGIWLGFIFGLGGISGILLGGYSAGRWLAGREQTQMRLSAVAISLLVPCFVMFLLAPQDVYALGALIPLGILFNCILGPAFALMQRLVKNEARATTLALVMLLANLVGMGIAPLAVGLLSDLLRVGLGTDSLRWAMLTVSLAVFWAAQQFWQGGKTVEEDILAIAQSDKASPDMHGSALEPVHQ
jgi:predicted MFS family arabinose efflux permease